MLMVTIVGAGISLSATLNGGDDGAGETWKLNWGEGGGDGGGEEGGTSF